MTIRFDGKVAIVTGGGNGLGRQHCLQLAARGAKVVVNDLGGAVDGSGGSISAAESVAKEIRDSGGEAIRNGADITKLDQVEAMVAGTHPRARTIGAIVEDPSYHARLLDYVRRFRRDPATPPLVHAEQTLRADPVFAAAERTFATLPGFVEYCGKLPRGVGELARRFRSLDRFPVELAGGG